MILLQGRTTKTKTMTKQIEGSIMESEIRFKFQGELLDNIRQNVKSGLYNFTGGKKQFEEWEKRAAILPTMEKDRRYLLRPID